MFQKLSNILPAKLFLFSFFHHFGFLSFFFKYEDIFPKIFSASCVYIAQSCLHISYHSRSVAYGFTTVSKVAEIGVVKNLR